MEAEMEVLATGRTGERCPTGMDLASLFPPSQGMKVSCTHFQCAAGAFAYLREHFPQAYSVDMSRQILTLNVNLMLVRGALRRVSHIWVSAGMDWPRVALWVAEWADLEGRAV